ncbi:MAG TPA: PaaI family thioesterase [Alphaproteobacteria bacterium]|nr:PaaI family thioesterase [Alphaproteobacteria bacterium]
MAAVEGPAEGPAGGPGIDPACAEVAERLPAQGFMRHLGVTVLALRPGYCELAVPHGPELAHWHGFFHGGVVGTMADVSTAGAAATVVEPGNQVLTAEYKINMMAVADGDRLIARARVVRAGRRLIVAEADIYADKGGEERHCATALATLMQMPRSD